MICIIALIVFGILGIFSASYRKVAAEAADCVFRRLTLRKCETGLDKRLKSKISGKVARKSPRLARFLHKYFEVFSWLFIVLFILSIITAGIGLTNYVKYGNCNGPENNGEFCIFDPLGHSSQYSGQSMASTSGFTMPVEDDDPTIGPKDAKVTVIQFGCTSCPFTKKEEPELLKTIKAFEGQSVRFVFKDFPIQSHPDAYPSSLALQCAYKSGKYLELRELLLNDQGSSKDESYYISAAENLGINTTSFSECLKSTQAIEMLNKDIESGKNAEVFGTPTFFINEEKMVGVKDSSALIKKIQKELKK